MELLLAECFCPSPSPNLYVEALNSSVAVFGNGASKEAIKVK